MIRQPARSRLERHVLGLVGLALWALAIASVAFLTFGHLQWQGGRVVLLFFAALMMLRYLVDGRWP